MKTNRLMAESPYSSPTVRVVTLKMETACFAGSEYGADGAAGDYNSDKDHKYTQEY